MFDLRDLGEEFKEDQYLFFGEDIFFFSADGVFLGDGWFFCQDLFFDDGVNIEFVVGIRIMIVVGIIILFDLDENILGWVIGGAGQAKETRSIDL